MYTLIAATTNAHKLREIRSILNIRSIALKSLADFKNSPTVIEDGQTFEENAIKKAREYYEFFRQPVIADDSGLEVDALNNEPGVFSARYAGERATDADNNRLLLERMRHIPAEKRQARFICTVCFTDGKNLKTFTGVRQGIILHELQGEKGFGYDPLFFIPEYQKTYAQMDREEKNRISHRGLAFAQLKAYLEEKLNFSEI